MLALIDEYNEVVAPIANVIVGYVDGLMDRAVRTAAGESTLGRLIADAQLASTQNDAAPGVIAFMNPGGIRSNLEGEITHGEAFAVQPFSNIVTTKTMTGAQIKTVLEQQFTVNSLSNPGAVGATLRAVNARAILLVEGFHLHMVRVGSRRQQGQQHGAERRSDRLERDLPGDDEQLHRRWRRRPAGVHARHE